MSETKSQAAPAEGASKLSEEQAKVYDRQIRLWGVEAQERLQNSRVLVVGRFGGTLLEVTKNVVLAGFSLTICDDGTVTGTDLGANYYLNESDVGQLRAQAVRPRVQELNPFASVTSEVRSIESVDRDFIAEGGYNVVVVSDAPLAQLVRINSICRETDALFFALDTYGFLAVGFNDLGANFQYKKKANGKKQPGGLQAVPFVPLDTALASPWSELQARRWGTPELFYCWLALKQSLEAGSGDDVDEAAVWQHLEATAQAAGLVASEFVNRDVLSTMIRCFRVDVSPACAILGGVIAQEITKAIARKEKPLGNFFFLDAMGTTSLGGGLTVKSIPASLGKP